jgi:hypothetical protein
MTTQTFLAGGIAHALAFGLALLGAAPGHAQKPSGRDKGAKGPAPAYKLSEPATHENLTIYLIRGEERLGGKKILTLQEALESKTVTVFETGETNTLAMRNDSKTDEVFVQSGDIVKGGQQDRTVAYDFILPPRSKKIYVTVWCVEHGRWRQRGRESATTFSSSATQLATRELKLAAKYAGAQGGFGGAQGGGARGYRGGFQGVRGGGGGGFQGGVWANVTATQEKLRKSLGSSVRSAESVNSLQLTLEHDKVGKAVAEYTEKLSGMLKGKTDVVGFAFAVNGKVSCADIYASPRLFEKMWPKLLHAAAVEALAERRPKQQFAAVKAQAIQDFLARADKGKASKRQVSRRIRMMTREAAHGFLFETRDGNRKDLVIHQSYLAK